MFTKDNLPITPVLRRRAEEFCISCAKLSNGGLSPKLVDEFEQKIQDINSHYVSKMALEKDIDTSGFDSVDLDDYFTIVQPSQINKRIPNINRLQRNSKKHFQEDTNTLHVNNRLITRLNAFNGFSKVNDIKLQIDNVTSKADKVLYAIAVDYFLRSNSYYPYHISPIFISSILTDIKGSSLFSMGKAFHERLCEIWDVYEMHDSQKTSMTYEIYINLVLDSLQEQISYMQTHLNIKTLDENLRNHVAESRLNKQKPLPKYSVSLLRELLIQGELNRGQVKGIIGKETRTATTLVQKLTKMGYIKSDTPKSKISLKLSNKLFTDLVPDLLPKYRSTWSY